MPRLKITRIKLHHIVNSLLFLGLFLVSLGQLGRISFLNQQVNIYAYEPTVFFLIIILFIKYKFDPIKESFTNLKSLFLFFGVLVFSFLINIPSYNPADNLVAFLYFLRLLMYFSYFLYLRFYFKKEKESILSKAIILFILLTAIFSIIQYFLYPNLRNLFYLGWDPHLYRMFGLFFDTSIAGAIYGIIFLYLLGGCPKVNKYLRLVLMAVYFVFIILSFSRSLYLVITITIIFVFLRRKSFKFLIPYFLLFILLLILVPKPSGEGVNLFRLFSIESRITSDAQALKIWKKKPILGIGYNHIRSEKIHENIQENNLVESHAGASFHSSFLIILVSSGVIGLILFLLFLQQLALIGQLSLVLILFLSLLSLSDNILLHPFILFLLLSSLSDRRQ